MLEGTARLVEGIGWGRVGLGALTLAWPTVLPRALGMTGSASREAAWLVRMFAGREAAIGAGSVRALRTGDVGPWLVGQALADGGDALALAVAVRRGHVSTWRGVLVVAAALGGVAADLFAAATTER